MLRVSCVSLFAAGLLALALGRAAEQGDTASDKMKEAGEKFANAMLKQGLDVIGKMSTTPFYQPWMGGKEKSVLRNTEEVTKHFKNTVFPESVKLQKGAEVITAEQYVARGKPKAEEIKALGEVLKKEDRFVKLRIKGSAMDADLYVMIGSRDGQLKVVGYTLISK